LPGEFVACRRAGTAQAAACSKSGREGAQKLC
jgi:hypothetical protein